MNLASSVSGWEIVALAISHIWSKVGVMYRIKLIRKKGTCRTEFARKSNPPTSLSSQVTESKLMKKANAHSVALTASI